jgi:multiple sugar transport system ATP-binding protein
MNLLEAPVVDGGVDIGGFTVPVSRDELAKAGTRVTVGVRPEDLELTEQGLPVEVDVVEELGADAYVYGRTTVGGDEHHIIARVDGRRPPQKGEVVHLTPKAGHTHLFSTRDGRRLGD